MTVFNLETLISLFSEISKRDREKYLCAITSVETSVNDKKWLESVVRNGDIFSKYLLDSKSRCFKDTIELVFCELDKVNKELSELQSVLSVLMHNLENTDSGFLKDSMRSNIQALVKRQEFLLRNKKELEQCMRDANDGLKGMGVFQ